MTVVHGVMNTPDMAGRRAAMELDLAKRIAETLHREYPGHAWGVNVTKGIIDIKDLSLSGSMGYTLHVLKLGADWRRKVLNAAGEILERYRVARGKLDDDKLLILPRDFKGDLHCDRS